MIDDGSGPLSVSVVIAAYNAADTLRRAIASVIVQSRQPAEIIVVDDASTDQTRDLVRDLSHEAADVPIRLICRDVNGGAGSARNIGWNAATSQFVAFLDADDAWHPRKLEIQHAWFDANPDVALCGHRCVVRREYDPVPEVDTSALQVSRFALPSFLVANRLSTPTVMVRRSIKNRFKEGKRYSEDYLLWMQIVAAHGPAAFIDLPLAFLFKARYGAAGLSSRHWAMRQGEIETFAQLRRQGAIGWPAWTAASAWGWLKFAARILGPAEGFTHR